MIPRRTALKVLSVGAITAFTGTVALAQQQKLRVRRSLTGMPLNDPDLSAYRDFVGIMKKKDPQPGSWLGFANQHGSLQGGVKFCPHGDWYFLPWHRAYVLMYETAVQVVTGKTDFAMPYWNWTEMRQLPTAYSDPTYNGSPNPLFVPNRNTLTGQYALTDALVGQKEVMDKIYEETVFELFGTSRNPSQMDLNPSWVPAGGGNQGILERTPHNNVHNNIGAFMPSWASPRDPVFMMHHGNIDRIWATWTALGRKNTTDKLWLDMPFANNYLKPDGTPYSAIVRDLQDISALGYTYDYLPKSDKKTSDPARDGRLLAILNSGTGVGVAGVQRLGGANETVASVAAPLSKKLMLANNTVNSITAPAVNARSLEIFALIRDIKIGDGVKAIRVFVNHPDLSTQVTESDPHYVTTLSFLGHKGGAAHPDGEAHKGLPSAIVDLTETLHKLSGFNRLSGDEITVQLIPVPVSGLILEVIGGVVPASIEIVVL